MKMKGMFWAKLVISILIVCYAPSVKGSVVTLDSSNTSTARDITFDIYLINASGDTTSYSPQNLRINTKHKFHLSLKNPSSEPQERFLRFGERYLNVYAITIFSNLNNKQELVQASSLPLSFKPYEQKDISFTVNELIKNDPHLFSLRLLPSSVMEAKTKFMHVSQAFFVGIFIFFCLLNLIMFFVTRWKIYLKYTLFILFSTIYFLYFYGLLQEIFPALWEVSNNLIQIWYSLIFIAYFYFINDFGQYKIYSPKAYYLLNLGIVYKLAQSLFDTFFHLLGADFIYSRVYRYGIMGAEIILMICIIYYIARNKNIRGKLVIAASLVIIIGGIMDQLIEVKSFEHAYFVEFAVLLELLIFSVGLSFLSKIYKQENEAINLKYLEQVKHATEIEEKLEKEKKRQQIAPDVVSFIKIGNSHKRIDPYQIVYLKADGSYCKIYMADGTVNIVSSNLQQTMNKLEKENDQFIRIHRSYVINKMYLEAFTSKEVQIHGIHLPLSKTYASKLPDFKSRN